MPRALHLPFGQNSPKIHDNSWQITRNNPQELVFDPVHLIDQLSRRGSFHSLGKELGDASLVKRVKMMVVAFSLHTFQKMIQK